MERIKNALNSYQITKVNEQTIINVALRILPQFVIPSIQMLFCSFFYSAMISTIFLHLKTKRVMHCNAIFFLLLLLFLL